MKITGAGGTPGGTGNFMLAIIMMCGGFYMLLNAITITGPFSLGAVLFHFGGSGGITSGMLLIPFLFGVGMVFFNARKFIGWLLLVGSIVALVFGVLASLQLSFRQMSLFDLLVILVLCGGGTGLLFSSLRSR